MKNVQYERFLSSQKQSCFVLSTVLSNSTTQLTRSKLDVVDSIQQPNLDITTRIKFDSIRITEYEEISHLIF